MSEKYLTINAGSSSLKFSLYDMPETKEIVNGYIEKIGNDDSYGNKSNKFIIIDDLLKICDIIKNR